LRIRSKLIVGGVEEFSSSHLSRDESRHIEVWQTALQRKKTHRRVEVQQTALRRKMTRWRLHGRRTACRGVSPRQRAPASSGGSPLVRLTGFLRLEAFAALPVLPRLACGRLEAENRRQLRKLTANIGKLSSPQFEPWRRTFSLSYPRPGRMRRRLEQPKPILLAGVPDVELSHPRAP
jgi:hypothetical protein